MSQIGEFRFKNSLKSLLWPMSLATYHLHVMTTIIDLIINPSNQENY